MEPAGPVGPVEPAGPVGPVDPAGPIRASVPEKVILLPLPTKTCPAVIELGVSVNPVKAVGIKVPSVAIGKFTSCLF